VRTGAISPGLLEPPANGARAAAEVRGPLRDGNARAELRNQLLFLWGHGRSGCHVHVGLAR
jgi:hypothetical protein